jgi:hypothetical protein
VTVVRAFSQCHNANLPRLLLRSETLDERVNLRAVIRSQPVIVQKGHSGSIHEPCPMVSISSSGRQRPECEYGRDTRGRAHRRQLPNAPIVKGRVN